MMMEVRMKNILRLFKILFVLVVLSCLGYALWALGPDPAAENTPEKADDVAKQLVAAPPFAFIVWNDGRICQYRVVSDTGVNIACPMFSMGTVFSYLIRDMSKNVSRVVAPSDPVFPEIAVLVATGYFSFPKPQSERGKEN